MLNHEALPLPKINPLGISIAIGLIRNLTGHISFWQCGKLDHFYRKVTRLSRWREMTAVAAVKSARFEGRGRSDRIFIGDQARRVPIVVCCHIK
jgi:hypothetical protein